MTPTEQDIAAVYRSTVIDLYRFVSRRAGAERALVEDVVQEAYLRAVEAWRRDGLPDAPLAWLYTVAGNLLRESVRRSRPRPVEASEIDSWMKHPGRHTSTETCRLVQWGLSKMRPDRAQLLQAFYFDGASTRQLGIREQLSEKAIERRLARSRQELCRMLEPHVIANSTSSTRKEQHIDG